MRYSLTVTFSALLLLLGAQGALGQKGVSGTIYLRNGNAIEFEYFGNESDVYDISVEGNLKGQEVEYSLTKLKEVVLSTKNKDYDYDGEGNIVLENMEGEKFTITKAYIEDNDDSVKYAYQDPVTRDMEYTTTDFEDISSISLGESRGKMRMNPDTEDYFPPTFVYDPYTGEKLVWADR